MRKPVALILFFALLPIFFTSSASASIYTCNSTGSEKTSFYTNDTVYVASSTNITDQAKSIKFYVATHRIWSVGINLSNVAKISNSISTNSSGHVPISVLWSPELTVGKYNVVVDINGNGTYDSEDLLYNATGDGFSVLKQPVPRLTVSKGANSPSDHDWYAEVAGKQNEMLQVVLEAGSYEGINVNKIYISAFGKGDDRLNVRYFAVCVDGNKDGKCGTGEDIIGFGQYKKDDGVANIDTTGKLKLGANSSVSLVFYYVMKSSSGSAESESYGFRLVMFDAFGSSTEARAEITGLPIQSAVKTVYPQVNATTTTTTTVPTTTTTVPTTVPTTTISEEEEAGINLLVGLAVAIFVVIALITIFYFFFLRPPPQVYSYKP